MASGDTKMAGKILMRTGLVLVGVSGLQHVVNASFNYSIVDKIAGLTSVSWLGTGLFVVAGGASLVYAIAEWK